MIPQVSPSQFSSWVGSVAATASVPVTPVLLDVREPWEVQTACVSEDGFKLMIIPMREVPARLAELDPEQPIACLCHHGMRSLQVANFLVQNGFTEVVNLQGGIDAWSNEIDPSVPRY
ncbi:MAG: rhodanese-like domain-containing protein [Polaromonas sp.]|jgi:rhodanese-related sulfurtransferase|nr:rhodanese-like domain-containing protein [Polaromonas sp.]